MKIAIVGSAALVSAAIIAGAAFGRYEVATTANGNIALRIDRLTGQIDICTAVYPSEYLDPTTSRPKWCAQNVKHAY